MDPIGNAVLGAVFLLLGAAGTFLMFHLWKYPFDHEKLKSEAPLWLMLLHRIIGYLYGAIYIYFMTQMVPRMWEYQIEIPARTVAHLTLGMAIGAILIIKIAIVRYFKHLESALVPALGTVLLVCTVLLIGLSAPFAFHETYLRTTVLAGDLFGAENIARVHEHLATAGLEDQSELERFSSPESLQAGRVVLSTKCIECHDLRTVLARPRTPDAWRQTVRRMAERSSLFDPISEDEQWAVTSYLIAISPDLQRSARERRSQEQVNQASKAAAEHLVEATAEEPASYDPQRAEQLFQGRCSLCHPVEMIEVAPPESADEARQLVARMVNNGMPGTEEELAQIVQYITHNYVR